MYLDTCKYRCRERHRRHCNNPYVNEFDNFHQRSMPCASDLPNVALLRKMHEVKARLLRHRTAIETKEANKTVSLGTSKVNYMDPRITVAWCKKVPWWKKILFQNKKEQNHSLRCFSDTVHCACHFCVSALSRWTLQLRRSFQRPSAPSFLGPCIFHLHMSLNDFRCFSLA